jgi:hypothetical protein
MQFVYRLGAVVFGTATFLLVYVIGVLIWLTHDPTAASHVNGEPSTELALGYVIGGSVLRVAPFAALAAWIVVRTWRWVCGQDDPRPRWMKYPRTSLEKRVSDFVREHAHKARPLDYSHLPSIRDMRPRREPTLFRDREDLPVIEWSQDGRH